MKSPLVQKLFEEVVAISHRALEVCIECVTVIKSDDASEDDKEMATWPLTMALRGLAAIEEQCGEFGGYWLEKEDITPFYGLEPWTIKDTDVCLALLEFVHLIVRDSALEVIFQVMAHHPDDQKILEAATEAAWKYYCYLDLGEFEMGVVNRWSSHQDIAIQSVLAGMRQYYSEQQAQVRRRRGW